MSRVFLSFSGSRPASIAALSLSSFDTSIAGSVVAPVLPIAAASGDVAAFPCGFFFVIAFSIFWLTVGA